METRRQQAEHAEQAGMRRQAGGGRQAGECQEVFRGWRAHFEMVAGLLGRGADGVVNNDRPRLNRVDRHVLLMRRRRRQLSTGRCNACLQSCVKSYTYSGEKVWEGCGKMGKGLEGPKSHDMIAGEGTGEPKHVDLTGIDLMLIIVSSSI